MEKVTKLDKAICKSIILAQVASDAGKGIDDLYFLLRKSPKLQNDIEDANWMGYSAKDKYIISAIKNICKSKQSHVRFYVTKCDIVQSYLVYFTANLNGKRYQVSFHSFCHGLEKFCHSNEITTHWDKKSSRNSCHKLAQICGLDK